MIYHLRWLNLLLVGVCMFDACARSEGNYALKPLHAENGGFLRAWAFYIRSLSHRLHYISDLLNHPVLTVRVKDTLVPSWVRQLIFGFGYCFHSAGGLSYYRLTASVAPPQEPFRIGLRT
jgi:hypothetical protein